ncbi:MAG: hypothetical protein V5789_08885 [Colwellia sp.]
MERAKRLGICITAIYLSSETHQHRIAYYEAIGKDIIYLDESDFEQHSWLLKSLECERFFYGVIEKR